MSVLGKAEANLLNEVIAANLHATDTRTNIMREVGHEARETIDAIEISVEEAVRL